MGIGTSACKRKEPPETPVGMYGNVQGDGMVDEPRDGAGSVGKSLDRSGQLTSACAQVAARLTGQAAQRLQEKTASNN